MSLNEWGNDNPELYASSRLSMRDSQPQPPDVYAKETLKMLKKADREKIDFIFKQLPDT